MLFRTCPDLTESFHIFCGEPYFVTIDDEPPRLERQFQSWCNSGSIVIVVCVLDELDQEMGRLRI